MYTSDDIYKQLANNQYINIDYWPHIFGLLSRENKKGIHFCLYALIAVNS